MDDMDALIAVIATIAGGAGGGVVGDGGVGGGGDDGARTHWIGLSVGKTAGSVSAAVWPPANGAVVPYPKLSSTSVPPKLVSRAMESTTRAFPLRACVLTYMLT